MSFVCLNFNFCGHPVVRSPNNYYSPHHSSISTVILFNQHALLKGPCNHTMDEFSTRAVAKISSCRVYAISRRGIGINLGFWKLPTYPSPKPTLSSSSQLGNVGLGEGQVGSFPETYIDQGIVQQGSTLDFFFLLFLIKVAGAHAHRSREKSPTPGSQ